MSKYIFECTNYNEQEEREIPMRDYDKEKSNQICKCGEKMNRVFTPIGLTEYHCSGFYDTDNRKISSR